LSCKAGVTRACNSFCLDPPVATHPALSWGQPTNCASAGIPVQRGGTTAAIASIKEADPEDPRKVTAMLSTISYLDGVRYAVDQVA
jgi:hypothetical protein